MNEVEENAIIISRNVFFRILLWVKLALCICGFLFSAALLKKRRYQVDENIRTLLLFIPVVLAHFAINTIPSFGYLIYMQISPNFNPKLYPIMEEAINWIFAYGTVLPMVVVIRERHILNVMNKIMRLNGVGILVFDRKQLHNTHQNIIQQGW
uniref:G_PROTEIN_RECEP_F1_2 domain-containing protein n=1 Tax=Heterorhabditis bacteriophora TaxID=37862 RepID=A0A1I7WCH6_HETBA